MEAMQGARSCVECFRMTSLRPYWCPKTMKRRPCWCPKPVLWELNSAFFCSNKFAYMLATWVKTLYTRHRITLTKLLLFIKWLSKQGTTYNSRLSKKPKKGSVNLSCGTLFCKIIIIFAKTMKRLLRRLPKLNYYKIPDWSEFDG